jgi:hypothetical protein
MTDEYKIYGGASPASIDEVTPLATVVHPTNQANVAVAAGEKKFFLVKASRTGAGESVSSNVVVAEVGPGGSLVSPQPNSPSELSAECLAGGDVRLCWIYDPSEQEAPPSVFNVFHDNGFGIVDYVTVRATKAYSAGRVEYSVDVSGLSDGTRYVFGVRARTSGGVEEKNAATVGEVSDATGPSAFGVGEVALSTVDLS